MVCSSISFTPVVRVTLAPNPSETAVEAMRLTKTYRPMASIRYWLGRGLGRPTPANGASAADEVQALSDITFAIGRGDIQASTKPKLD